VIFLLFAISIVNYIDRAAISYSIPQIERDLGLSPTDAGGILGAFGLGYAITTVIGGFVVDRFGSRSVLAIAAVLWSLSIGATGLATGLGVLYGARVLLGISEGPNFPALTGAVSHWLAPRERATALGNALVAVPLALAIGGPIVTQLLGWFGWRGMFLFLFAPSIVWVPLWLWFFRDDPARSRFVNAAELDHIRAGGNDPSAAKAVAPSGTADIRFLLTNRTLLANYWAYFVYGYFLFFFKLSGARLWPSSPTSACSRCCLGWRPPLRCGRSGACRISCCARLGACAWRAVISSPARNSSPRSR
jgi:ACS family hexuronate transporter-like MFS transporter